MHRASKTNSIRSGRIARRVIMTAVASVGIGGMIDCRFAAAATTYTWANANIPTSTTPTTFDWFTGGSHTQGSWTGGTPVSGSAAAIQFFNDSSTPLGNTVPVVQNSNINNGGTAFSLTTLNIIGQGSSTASAKTSLNITGDPLDFVTAAATISDNSTGGGVGATIATDIQSNIQLGTPTQTTALTVTSTTPTVSLTISGNISENKAGGSVTRSGSGTDTVTFSGSNTYTGKSSFTGGTSVVASLNSVAVSNAGSNLGVPSSTTNGSIAINGNAALIYNGTGETSDRNFNLGTSGIGASIIQNGAGGTGTAGALGTMNNGSGVLKLTGQIVAGGGTTQVTFNGSGTGEVSGSITGTGGVIRNGNGTWSFSGANTYTGKTTIAGSSGSGLLVITSFNSVVGGGPSSSLGAPVTAANGVVQIGTSGGGFAGNLRYTGTGETTDRGITFGNGTNFLEQAGTVTASGAGATATMNNGTGVLKITGAVTLTASGTLTGSTASAGEIAGTIGGAGGLVKNGTGVWVLSAPNVYTGNTTLTSGVLQVAGTETAGTSGPLGNPTTPANSIKFNGGYLQWSSGNTFDYSSRFTNVSSNNFRLDPNGQTVTLASNFPATSAAIVVASNNNNGGTISFSGTNTSVTGVTSILSATAQISSPSNLAAGQIQFNAVTGGSAGTLSYNGSGNTITNSVINFAASRATLDQSGSGPLIFSNSVSASPGFQGYHLTGSTSADGEIDGVVGGGFCSILKDGTGRWILTNANTYPQPTTINAGILNVWLLTNGSTASGIGQTTNAIGNLIFGGGALQYDHDTAPMSTDRLFTIGNTSGNTGTIDSSSATSANSISFTNSGAIAFGNTSAHSLTLAGSNTGDNSFAPSLADHTGATSLVKSGVGRWILSNVSNTYSGSTAINGGTLSITGNLTQSKNITVDATGGAAALLLDNANALPAAATVTGVGAMAVVTATTGQSIAALNSPGTTSFTGGSSIVGSIGGSGMLIVGSSATVTATNALTHGAINSAGTVNLLGGTSNTVNTIDGNGLINITGANLTSNHIRHGTVNVNAGSTLSIATSLNPGNTDATSYATSLNIDSAGTLDINNNSLVVEYGGGSSPLTTIQAQITQAYDSNAWDQAGLTSTSARNHPSQYGIGIAEASVLAASQGFGSITTFEGVNFSSGNAVLVKYTLRGDTTLRGSVGLQDFNKVVSNFNTAQNWSGGNFDNSGLVGLGDYNNVVSNFNLTATGSAAPANFVGPTLAGGAVTHAAPGGGGTASASGASSDLRLEVNTITGHVSLLAMTNVAFTGYNIADPSKNLLAGTGGAVEQLLSQHASNKINWSVIKDDSTTLAEGENLSKYKATKSSTWDTIQLTAGQTIDFGAIFNTTANVHDLTFQFSEANTSTGDPTTGQTFSVGSSGVDYTPVPEPTTVSMLAIGAMGLLGRRGRRKHLKAI